MNFFLYFKPSIPANFKSIVFTTLIETGSEDDWMFFYKKMLNTTNEADKLKMLAALTKSKDLKLLKL
jgi:hypothetical protein